VISIQKFAWLIWVQGMVSSAYETLLQLCREAVFSDAAQPGANKARPTVKFVSRHKMNVCVCVSLPLGNDGSRNSEGWNEFNSCIILQVKVCVYVGMHLIVMELIPF